MAGGKGETAGAVPSRAGYRISRIEAPAPVENLRSNNAGSGDRRGCASSEMEARNEQHQHPARSRGGGRSGSKNSGKGRRGKRGGGEFQESVSSGAGTISARKECSDRSVTFSKSGDNDRAVSSRRRNHQQQPRGGRPRKTQTHVQQSSQTHVNTIQIGDLPSSYLALPQDGDLRGGRLHDVELGTSRGFPRAPREERPQVGRLQGSCRDDVGSREKANVGASSPIRSIGRERSTAARVDPYEGQMLRQSVGHQAHSSESSPRPASDVGEALSSRAGISGTRYLKASSSQHAKGTCMSMCPVEEARSREVEGALSVFEATDATAMLPFRQRVADPKRTVKKYRRSAAGRDMHSPEQLRPLDVLQMTARYLVEVIFANTCVKDGVDFASRGMMTTDGIRHRGSSNTLKAYLFVEDRLRAVRQDMTVQGIALTAGAAEVLKTIANFYIVSDYLLCDQPADVFDRHLHTRELQGVFSSLAELFFQARGHLCPREAMVGMDEYLCLQAVHALVTAVHNCFKEDASLEEAAQGKGVGRVFTSTVSKLCGSSVGKGMGGAMSGGRLMSLDGPFRKTFPKMAAAIRLLGAVGVGNWSEFHRVLGRYPVNHAVEPLVGDEDAGSAFAVRLRCLCHGMLLPLRVHAIRAMNRSFGKGERVPLADLKRTLRMRDDAHAAGLCRALSLPIHDETVTFKSVPAVWKTQHGQNKGYLPPTRTAECDWPATSLREDDWVGLNSVLEMTNVRGGSTARGRGWFGAVPLCEGCGGHGCSWCTEGDVSEGVGEGRRLWEDVLAPE